MSLPIISITPWLKESGTFASRHDADARLNVSNQIHTACVEYGFFYLDISDFASSEETQELERLARGFFDQPQALKDEISISKQDYARGTYMIKISREWQLGR